MSFGPAALAYFVARAIDPELAASCGVREAGGSLVYPCRAPDGTPFDRLRSLNGAGPAKVKQPPGQPLAPWWPLGRPPGAEAVVVAEGESDALAALEPLSESRYVSLEVVAVPGTGFPPRRLAEQLAEVGVRDAFLALDADEAGRAYAEKAASALREAGIRPIVVELQEGTDLAETLARVDDRRGWIDQALADAEAVSDSVASSVELPEPVPAGRLRVRRADLSRVRPVQWLWGARLPIGYLALLLGAEGIGKGVLIAWLIARLTRGELAGDLEGTPTRVLIVGDEDSFDSVVLPRLYAAGADLAQVDELSEEDGADVLDVRRDAERLRALIREGRYSLVFVDALLDVIGVDTDDWRSKAVRDALRPLRRAARDLDVSVLGALHPNKGQRSSFRDLVSGTHAYNASSRSSLLLAQHPDDEGRRVLVRGKGNLSAPPPSFEFALEGRDLEINGHGFSLPVVADERDGELGAEDMLKPERPAPVRENLADQLDALGTGEIQSRAELAHALGRESDDRSVGRALDQLEEDGRWLKEGRGKWRRFGIGTSSEVPMPTLSADGDSSGGDR